MDEKTKSVDSNEELYAELRKTLENESAVEETVAADDQKPTEEKPSESEITDDDGDISEEEISKLHPKAQKRIKELADKVKELADAKADEIKTLPEESPEPKPDDSYKFKDVKEFLDAVEDEPSRKLLEKFYGVIKAETSTILAPIEQKNNETKFETEFSKYEKIDGLSDYKNDLKKTFLRNPNQSFKALIGETIADLQLNKVKPIEKTPSSPNRGGKVNTDEMTLEQLYTTLESQKQ